MTRFPFRSASLGLSTLAILSLPGISAGAELDDVVRTFENNKNYVRPIATIFGSATNSGWYQSSAIPYGFSFYVGLPLNVTRISEDDRSFQATWADNGCRQYHQYHPGGPQVCRETTNYTAPTLFGSGRGPVLDSSSYSPTTNSISGTFHVPLNDGNAEAASFQWFPFGEPQIGFSFRHTELKLRYFALPLDIFSVYVPGVGIQHDLASFLPPLPVSLSVAANLTWLSGEWKPGKNVDGKVTLNGTSAFYGILAGYTYGRWLEVFLETGWENASLQTGGNLVIHDKDKVEADQNVRPNLTLEGRNGFRAGVNIAFHFGYDAVFGLGLGANQSNQVGMLAYRYKSWMPEK